LRASNIAVGEPAQRAPTTIASNALVIAAFSVVVTIRSAKRFLRRSRPVRAEIVILGMGLDRR
jgi:hypothetical protein